MITVFVRRVVPLLGLAGALVLLVRLQDVPVVGSDAYLHLRLGQEFLDGWSIGRPGHLGVFDTGTWYPTQWLSQVAMAWAESVWGMAGVIWLAGTLILALPVCLYLACRQWVAPLPAVIAAVLGTCGAAPGLTARPQVVSYLLILLVTAAWLRTAQDLKPRYWLVLVAWAWVPLHAMWPVGVSIGLAATFGIALSGQAPARLLLRMLAIPVGSVAIAVATPLGIHAYTAIASVGQRTTQLTEWQPPDFTSPNVVVVSAMVAITLVVALRGPAVDWPTVMLLGVAMVWAVYSVRTTLVAAVILTPLLAMALQRLVPQVERIGRVEVAFTLAMLAVASGALAVVAHQRADTPVVAAWVDDRLDEMPAGTTVLNDWDLGQYALFRHPQVDVVMHGYVDLFTVDELERNVDIVRLAPGWDREVADLDVDYAFVDPDTALGYALQEQLGWDVVEGDDDYVLLRPPTP